MADADDPVDRAELAPNQWFAEYGMPYTTMILEAEAEALRDNPELAGEPRAPLAQFIIDQETAVARDYHAGDISKAEFAAYKAAAQDRFDGSVEKIEQELEEFEDDISDWGTGFEVSLQAFAAEHKVEIDELNQLASTAALTEKDVSLHLFADVLGVSVNGVDDLLERVPSHLHDVLSVLGDETLDTARELLEARSELSSADDHDLSRDAERLDTLEPVFEAELDQAHEAIDRDFDRVDNDLDQVQDYVEDVQAHATLNPELTIEHLPTRHTDDYDLPAQINEETGVYDV